MVLTEINAQASGLNPEGQSQGKAGPGQPQKEGWETTVPSRLPLLLVTSEAIRSVEERGTGVR